MVIHYWTRIFIFYQKFVYFFVTKTNELMVIINKEGKGITLEMTLGGWKIGIFFKYTFLFTHFKTCLSGSLNSFDKFYDSFCKSVKPGALLCLICPGFELNIFEIRLIKALQQISSICFFVILF